MGAILDLLERIRKRPGIFLGRPSVSNLYMFLSGFTYARKDSDPGDQQFLAGFGQWVHDRYKVTSTQGWAKIIEFYSLNEVEEMELFWKLLDQYLAEQMPAQKKVS
jgi:hypothetical protein